MYLISDSRKELQKGTSVGDDQILVFVQREKILLANPHLKKEVSLSPSYSSPLLAPIRINMGPTAYHLFLHDAGSPEIKTVQLSFSYL